MASPFPNRAAHSQSPESDLAAHQSLIKFWSRLFGLSLDCSNGRWVRILDDHLLPRLLPVPQRIPVKFLRRGLDCFAWWLARQFPPLREGNRNLSMLQPSLEPCDRFAHLSKCRRPVLEVAASRNRAFSRLGCINATLPRGPAHCRGVMRYVFSSPCPVGGGGWSFRSVHPYPYGRAAEDRESPAHPTEPRNPEVSLSTYNVTLNTQASIPSRRVALPELGRGFFDGAGQRWSQKLNRNLLSGWTAGGRFSDVYSSDECQMRAWVRVGMEDPSPTHPAPFHAT